MMIIVGSAIEVLITRSQPEIVQMCVLCSEVFQENFTLHLKFII